MSRTGSTSITLTTIASMAGVHPSTASRALSDTPVGISSDTVKRVRKIAGDLGYIRDITGASLRTGRTRMIGVLVPRLTDVVLAQIYESIDEAASAAGYNAVVANTRDAPEVQNMRLQGLLSRKVDGLIVGDSRAGSQVVERLARLGTPYTLVMRRLGEHPSVSTDDLEGGRLAAEHLLELGHTRVGVVAGDPLTSTGRERTLGFTRTYEQAGIHIPDDYVVSSSFDTATGRAAGDRLLSLDPIPTAVFAVNDFTAIGVMGALRDRGLQVGLDVALVGYNDISIAAQLTVPLTSVQSPLREMGRRSVEMLLDRIAGEETASVRLTPTLVTRESTLLGTSTVRRPA
jgi:LacI family transcriptional regulator